jgi:hypothetical protein
MECVHPFPIGVPPADRALEFKTDEKAGFGQPMNRDVQALLRPTGQLSNFQRLT